MNDIKDHRVLVDGHYYWIYPHADGVDAAVRGIQSGDLVRAFNDRGSVIVCAQVGQRMQPGTVHTYESCAEYDPLGKPGRSADRGGCMNILSPDRYMCLCARRRSVYTAGFKSMIVFDSRIMTPMKRVDFDPTGERNIQNRGISGYERISLGRGTDIVVSEINRVKREAGPRRSSPARAPTTCGATWAIATAPTSAS